MSSLSRMSIVQIIKDILLIEDVQLIKDIQLIKDVHCPVNQGRPDTARDPDIASYKFLRNIIHRIWFSNHELFFSLNAETSLTFVIFFNPSVESHWQGHCPCVHSEMSLW